MDRIFIQGLELQSLIGVLARERLAPQPIIVDVEMAFDTRAAAVSDRILDTLDYAAVAKRLGVIAEDSRAELVETLAERMAECLQREFGVRWLRLRIGKPLALDNAVSVGVEIERGTMRGQSGL